MTILIHNRQLVRYIFVGGTAYVIEMAVLYVLHDVLHYSSLAAVAISFWVGFAVAFIMQKFITFRNFDRNHRTVLKQLAGYSLLVAWNYVFTLVVISLFSQSVSVFILRTVAIVIVTMWNFVMYKKMFKASTA